MNGRLETLRHRDFRLLTAGQVLSSLGSSFTSVALAFAVLEATGSVADVGIVLAATRVPMIVFLLVGGVIGDRLPRRRVMLAADVLRFVTQGVAAVLLLAGEAQLWQLIVLFGLHGFGQAFFNPASTGLIPELVPDPELQSANAFYSLGRTSASLVGQLAGGVLVTVVGPGYAFAADSVTFLFSACALAAINVPGVVQVGATGPFLAELAAGWREVRSRRWLLIGTAHITLLNAFALVGFFALGPVVAQESLGGGASWGVIGAAFAAGMIAGGALALRHRPRRPLVAAFAAVFLAAPQLALLALRAPTALIAAAAFLGGLQASYWDANWTTAIQRAVAPDRLSRVTAYESVGGLALAPLAFVAVGFAAAAVGVSTVLWFGAAWVLGSTALVVASPSIRAVQSSSPT